MAGIVRAADRVALWHYAAEGESKPSTSTPPQGAPVVIPNTNKFKTPTNNLKNVLQTLKGSKNPAYVKNYLQNWLGNHPAYTKTYFKPQYNDALKASLGPDLYDHLVKHLPTEHATALTTHQQVPLPNSNKFKTPANKLKKLLADPKTDPQVIKDYTNKYLTHYLQPQYSDALKAYLGPQAHALLQNHLGVPVKPKPADPGGFQELKKKLQDYKPPGVFPEDLPQPKLAPPTNKPKIQLDYDETLGPKPVKPAPLGPITPMPPTNGPKKEHEVEPLQEWEQALMEQVHSPQNTVPPAKSTGPHHNQYTDPSQLEKNKVHPADTSGNVHVPGFDDDINAIKAEQPKLTPEQLSGIYDQINKVEPWDNHKQEWLDSVGKMADPEAYLQHNYPNALKKWQAQQADQPEIDAIKAEQGKPLTDPSYEIASDIYKINPNFQLTKLQKMSPDDAKALIQSQAQSHAGTPTGEAYTQLLNKHFGGGEQAQPGVGAQHPALAQALQKLFPQSPLNFSQMTDDEMKAKLEAFKEHLPGTPGLEGQVDGVNKLYDQYFGGGTPPAEQPQQKPFDKQQLLDDWAATSWGKGGYYTFLKQADDPQQLLQSWAGPGHSKTLQNSAQQMLDKYFGGGGQPAAEQPQPAAPGADLDAAHADWLKIWPGDVTLLKTKMDTPEKAKAYVEKGLAEGGWGPSKDKMAQDWLSKYFGGQEPAAKSALPEWPQDVISGQIPAIYTDYSSENKNAPTHLLPGAAAFLAEKGVTPANASQSYSHFDEWQHLSPEEKQKYIDAEGGTPPAAHHGPVTLDEIKQIMINHPQSGWTGDSSGFSDMNGMSPEQMKSKLQEWANGGGMLTTPSQQAAQAALDQLFGSGAQQTGWKPAFGEEQAKYGPKGLDKTKTPTKEQLIAMGADPYDAGQIAQQSPSQFWKNYNSIKQSLDSGSTFWPGKSWGKIVNHNEQGGQPAAKPAWDPSAFADEYKSILPGTQSTLASGSVDPDYANTKLQNLIDSYPGTPQSVKLQALKDKWFGGGEETQAEQPSAAFSGMDFAKDITNNIYGTSPDLINQGGKKFKDMSYDQAKKAVEQHLHGGWESEKWQNLYDKWFSGAPSGGAPDPEVEAIKAEQAKLGPPEPILPFKSQKAKPEDLKKWLANKPQTTYGWKDFSTWWGNTKLTPKQETGLFKTWFGKDATPQQANDWFSAVFNQQSQPSEGDLKAQTTPPWATAAWAFGKNADKEWPTFQQWAANDPGIPKGLSVKQKLQIWQGLDPSEKSEIAANYDPGAVDTKGVMQSLQKAYPDSDWSNWAKMPPGTLKKNIENLAQAGYKPLIDLYNKTYGGTIPMPAEGEDATPKGFKVQTGPLIPANQMPSWAKKYWGAGATGQKNYTQFLNWASSVGKTQEVEKAKDEYWGPQELKKTWMALPEHLKYQIATQGKAPYQDLEGFKAWADAQPTLKDQISQIVPEKVPGLSSANWWWNSNSPQYAKNPDYLKKPLEDLITTEGDPAKKKALIDSYYHYFGAGKKTLGETLSQIGPPPPYLKTKNWDTWLQTHSSADAVKMLKKQIKTEPDPNKWVGYVDALYQHFASPSGMKGVTNYVGKQYNKGLNVNQLKALHKWKAQYGGDPSYYPYSTDVSYDAGPYVAAKEAEGWTGSKFPAYFGWTPPGGAGQSYQLDPALFGNTPAKSYQAPPAEATSQMHQKMLDRLKSFAPGVFSDADKKMLASPVFSTWFNAAPKDYQQVMADHPGIALDDYAAFMKGGKPYGDVPQGPAPKGKDKYYDTTPFANVPTKSQAPAGYPNYLMHTPAKEQAIKFPQYQDTQETLPLPPGQHWAPKYAPMPIYRIVPNNVLNLDGEPNMFNTHQMSPQERAHFAQLQRWRLRQIDQILNGTMKRNPQEDMDALNNWAKENHIPDQMKKDIADQVFAVQPTLNQDEQWKYFQDFAKQHNLSEMTMYDLANKLGVGNPGQAIPGQKGNYDDPRLGQLVLDYVEGAGGMGTHWTRDIDKLYNGIPSAGAGANTLKNMGGRQIPVLLSGLWAGQGETPSLQGGAYAPMNDSEREQNLLQGAPVHMRRVQIRDPQGNWHDVMDYGPMSLWPPGRNETASGKTVFDKPSLAANLSKDVGGHFDPQEWDNLTPGPQTDQKFAKLIHDHPEAEQRILHWYTRFFHGRPDLTLKPHMRKASLSPRTFYTLAEVAEERRNAAELGYGRGVRTPLSANVKAFSPTPK